MEVIWTDTALSSLERERNYIAENNPDAAERVYQAILTAVRHLELPSFEHMGRHGRVDETRELVVSATSYIVAYTVINATVYIIAVQHRAKEWPERF